jgi:hypothetical protein
MHSPVTPCGGPPHQRAALPLHVLIVAIFGVVALACIGGGIFAVWKGATSDTTFNLFGARMSTGSVGVAFVGIGVVIAYLTIKAVLKNQRDLGAL